MTRAEREAVPYDAMGQYEPIDEDDTDNGGDDSAAQGDADPATDAMDPAAS